MKKLQKIILSVLLFTFTFITVHDYVVPDLNQNVSHELSPSECDDSFIDTSVHLHESLHTLLFSPLEFVQVSSILVIYQKQMLQKDLFISQIGSVLQRPPLT